MMGIRVFGARIGCTALLAAVLLQPGIVLAQESTENLPAYYDIRLSVPADRHSTQDPKKALVNPIRRQGGYGTCWAHAAIAMIESNMYLQLQRAKIPYHVDQNTVNLSEWYLAWVSRCSPIGLDQDSIAHIISPEDVNNYRKPAAEKIYEGGVSMMFMEFMTANRASLAAEAPDADAHILQQLRAPVQYEPQAVQLRNSYTILQHNIIQPKDRPVIKKQIMEYGAACFALDANDMTQEMHEKAFFSPKKNKANHAVNIVGWDDDYDFSQTDLPDKPLHKGAWIIRNSWGTEWGDHGYCYVSYEDQTLNMPVVIDADLDLGAVSTIETNQTQLPCAALYYTDDLSSAWFADSETNEQNAFLKRVGFYTFNDGMSYVIEVRTGSDSPESGRLVYTQKDTLGKDGTPAWSGYRTIDLKKYVFVPAGTHYTVNVRLENPQGKMSLLMAPQFGKPPQAYVNNYIRIGDDKKWYKTLSNETPLKDKPLGYGLELGSVVQREYVKNVREAEGYDFTVASLDDSLNRGQANIYLGRVDELYKQDRLHPDRRTLSNMTLDLAEDQSYSGSIYGDGSVIKTGSGTLNLMGVEKYTGQTIVREGGICLAPRANGGEAVIAGDVKVAAGASFGGQGTVHGNISGQGTLILTADGPLQVRGTVSPELQLRLQKADKLQPGQVLLTSKQALPAGFAGQSAGSHHLKLDDSHTKLIVE
jgi:autotransporter-associated beta strand protein